MQACFFPCITEFNSAVYLCFIHENCDLTCNKVQGIRTKGEVYIYIYIYIYGKIIKKKHVKDIVITIIFHGSH